MEQLWVPVAHSSTSKVKKKNEVKLNVISHDVKSHDTLTVNNILLVEHAKGNEQAQSNFKSAITILYS